MGTTRSTPERDEKPCTSRTKRPLRNPESGLEDSTQTSKAQWLLYIDLQPLVSYESHDVSTRVVLCLK